jgi:hypothetical protein
MLWFCFLCLVFFACFVWDRLTCLTWPGSHLQCTAPSGRRTVLSSCRHAAALLSFFALPFGFCHTCPAACGGGA